MLGWDDVPKEPPPITRKQSIPHSTGTSGGGASESVIFADGKKAGWWQASEKGILNEADAADEKSAVKKGFTPQFGAAQSYGSIFARTASTESPAALPAETPAAVETQAPLAAVAVATSTSDATAVAVAVVTTKVGELDPFAELVGSGSGSLPAVTQAVAAAAAAGVAAATAAPAPPAAAGPASPAATAAHGPGGIEFADGKKTGWWAAADTGILNEADAADEAKGAKKFSAQFSVTGQKNNYGSMLNWKRDEDEPAPVAAAEAPPPPPAEVAASDAPAAVSSSGLREDEWDPFQSGAKP